MRSRLLPLAASALLAITALAVLTGRVDAAPTTSAPTVQVNTSARAQAVDTTGKSYTIRTKGRLASGKMSRLADDYRCTNLWDRADHTFGDDYIGGGFGRWREVYLQFTIYYRWCVPIPQPSTRLQFAEDNFAIGIYNVLDISHMTCNEFDRFLDSVNYNFKGWRPSTGATHNPGQVKIPCDETTENSREQNYNYSTTPRLYRDANGTMPKWDLVGETDVNNLGYPGVQNKVWNMTSRAYNP